MDKTTLCPKCGEPGMTKEDNHKSFKKRNLADPLDKGIWMYECPWDTDYYDKTGRLRRESLKNA